MTEGQTLTPPNDCEECDDCGIGRTKMKKQIVRIQEVENGYTVSSNYNNEFVAMSLEEAIILVRDALK